jgi:hypothetical protein
VVSFPPRGIACSEISFGPSGQCHLIGFINIQVSKGQT